MVNAMPVAFELHFDDRTEAAVRAAWDALTRLGCDTRHNGVAPHVTLAIAAAADLPDAHRPLLRDFAAAYPPFAVTLAAFARFPSGVAYLAPLTSEPLAAVHRDFHARFACTGAANSHYYLAGAWTPHCTLARHIPPDREADARAVVASLVLPLTGSFVRLRIVAYPAVALRLEIPLGPQ
jgi:2'-5' RNA ligase